MVVNVYLSDRKKPGRFGRAKKKAVKGHRGKS